MLQQPATGTPRDDCCRRVFELGIHSQEALLMLAECSDEAASFVAV